MIEINGYKFDGGGSCPEQYDVYKDDKYVAYVRFRWGNCTVRTDAGFDSDIICYYDKFDMWQGEFDSEKQRMYYLKLIAKQIEKYYQPKKPKRQYHKNKLNEKYGINPEIAKILFENLIHKPIEDIGIQIYMPSRNTKPQPKKLNKYKDYRKYKK